MTGTCVLTYAVLTERSAALWISIAALETMIIIFLSLHAYRGAIELVDQLNIVTLTPARIADPALLYAVRVNGIGAIDAKFIAIVCTMSLYFNCFIEMLGLL